MAIAASREHSLTLCCGLFRLKAFVLVDDGPLNPFSGRPVRRAIQHPYFGVVLGGKAAENHNIDVFQIHRSLHPVQFSYHLVKLKKNLWLVFSQLHLHRVEVNGESAPLPKAARVVVLHESSPRLAR